MRVVFLYLRARLQGGLQGDVTGGAAHEADEVVVLFRAQGVQHDVADRLGIHLLRLEGLFLIPTNV